MFISFSGFAQSIRLNEDGDKIVQFTDGSWRYYELKDSIFEVEDDATDSTLADHKKTNDYRMFQRYVVAAVAYEAEQADHDKLA